MEFSDSIQLCFRRFLLWSERDYFEGQTKPNLRYTNPKIRTKQKIQQIFTQSNIVIANPLKMREKCVVTKYTIYRASSNIRYGDAVPSAMLSVSTRKTPIMMMKKTMTKKLQQKEYYIERFCSFKLMFCCIIQWRDFHQCQDVSWGNQASGCI